MHLKAFFIFCATINSTYCSIWDLVMDWSLLNPKANHKFLRETLAFKNVWVYYLVILMDPVLRFNWIFYAIDVKDLQHSAALSFYISLSEVCRRGIWVIFRVENEHCTNVGRFRASRDVPLPFETEPLTSDTPKKTKQMDHKGQGASSSDEEARPQSSPDSRPGPSGSGKATGVDAATAHAQDLYKQHSNSPTLRRRRQTESSPLIRGINRVGSLMHAAHAEDFERKRRPEVGKLELSSDEDEGDEAVREAVREAEMQAEHPDTHHPHHINEAISEVEEHWVGRHDAGTVRRPVRPGPSVSSNDAGASSEAVSPGTEP